MIILEGPDAVGKTTLAKNLAEKLNMEYVKIPRTKDDSEKNGLKFYLQHAEQVQDNSVIDRFHIGEAVYPLLYKDDPRKPLLMWQQHQIERLLYARGCILINCMASLDFITYNYEQRQEAFVYSNLEKECNLFAEKIQQSILLKRHFIAEYTNIEKFTDKIQVLHDKIMNRALHFSRYHSTGGNFSPVMIVGDSINEKYGTKYAFCGWSNSSTYLHQALSIANCQTSYYLTNANKTNNYDENVSILMREIYDVQPLQIITLGQSSHLMLEHIKMKHSIIQHPAHHQRFKHDVYDYAHQIEEVLI